MKSSNRKEIYIDAFNLKSSGGLTVLQRILVGFTARNCDVIIVSNIRGLSRQGMFVFVKSLVARDVFLSDKRHVLYLSNIPPLFKKDRSTMLFYLHQRYWVDGRGYAYMTSMKSRLLYLSKLLFWKVFGNNLPNIAVQTEDMRDLLLDKGSTKDIKVFPVFNETTDRFSKVKLNGCLIIGDGAPHKHSNGLNELVEFLRDQKVGYKYVGYENKLDSDGKRSRWYSKQEYWELLRAYRFVAISSDFESLGLPFIEAAQAGCVVIVPKRFSMLQEILSEVYTIQEFRTKILVDQPFESPKVLITDKTNELHDYLVNLNMD